MCENILFTESSVSQIYFEFAGISKIRSPNFSGFYLMYDGTNQHSLPWPVNSSVNEFNRNVIAKNNNKTLVNTCLQNMP